MLDVRIGRQALSGFWSLRRPRYSTCLFLGEYSYRLGVHISSRRPFHHLSFVLMHDSEDQTALAEYFCSSLPICHGLPRVMPLLLILGCRHSLMPMTVARTILSCWWEHQTDLVVFSHGDPASSARTAAVAYRSGLLQSCYCCRALSREAVPFYRKEPGWCCCAHPVPADRGRRGSVQSSLFDRMTGQVSLPSFLSGVEGQEPCAAGWKTRRNWASNLLPHLSDPVPAVSFRLRQREVQSQEELKGS